MAKTRPQLPADTQLVARLTLVTVIAIGYGYLAAYFSVNRLGITTDALSVVRTAPYLPNFIDLGSALCGLILAWFCYRAGGQSARAALIVVRITGGAIVLCLLGYLALSRQWGTLVVTVIVGGMGAFWPKGGESIAIRLLYLSLFTGAITAMLVGALVNPFRSAQSVVLEPQPGLVTVVRSDSAGFTDRPIDFTAGSVGWPGREVREVAGVARVL